MQEYLSLRVEKIIPETPEAITLVLKPLNKGSVTYKAGQFLPFLFDINGKQFRRSYSLSSAPGVDKDLMITIKRVENGEVSRYLLSNLKEGDVLQSLMPTGRFTISTHPDNKRDIFLIGAGSGITPLFSLLKTVLKEEPQSHITFINSNKNKKEAFYEEEIETIAREYADQLTYFSLYSQPGEGEIRSRLNIDLLEKLVRENMRFSATQALFYLCGPMTFMRMARITLLYMGIHEDQIYKEVFLPSQQKAYHPIIPANTPPREIEVVQGKQKEQVTVYAQQSILRAALARGISIPYSCEVGICATCIAKCTSGKVVMTNNEVLTDREVDQGWILTCTSHPLEDGVQVIII
jgi:ring-1,2-phenylacetyl-CoA epoxidase subunit PaaE